jgi:predicted nucleic acid-binding protein
VKEITHILDTSTIVAMERGAPITEIHDAAWSTTAITVAELNIGLLRSTSAARHQQRLEMFELVCRRPILDFDKTVARTYAELVVWAGSIGSRPGVADGIIASTAATHGFVLVTLDQGFRSLADFDGLELLVLPHPEHPRRTFLN